MSNFQEFNLEFKLFYRLIAHRVIYFDLFFLTLGDFNLEVKKNPITTFRVLEHHITSLKIYIIYRNVICFSDFNGLCNHALTVVTLSLHTKIIVKEASHSNSSVLKHIQGRFSGRQVLGRNNVQNEQQ